jgi:uncharacterized protein (UPF0332 family)
MFDWNEYLQLAQQLSTLQTHAASRSAVSRAYYCAFHAASLSLQTNNVATNPKYQRDRHLRVWNIYILSSNKECRRIGNDGQRLKIARQSADYDPKTEFSDTRVQRCISQAQNLVNNIGQNVPESFSVKPGFIGRAISLLKRALGK